MEAARHGAHLPAARGGAEHRRADNSPVKIGPRLVVVCRARPFRRVGEGNPRVDEREVPVDLRQ